jgi:hypothetical protein
LAKRPSLPKQDARIEAQISEKRKRNIFAVRAGHVGQISDPGRSLHIGEPNCGNFSDRLILTFVTEAGGSVMNGIIYLVGLIVVIAAILSFFGLR